ncbi:hypothetical protein BSKO_03825 [Bryopsis sp. KO-2023]|nr:hypothetical protein BSKO_03825 [Bryopsis sp. KO-2023]
MGVLFPEDRDIENLKRVFDVVGSCPGESIVGDRLVIEDKPAREPVDVEGFAYRALQRCLGNFWVQSGPRFLENWAVGLRLENPPPDRPPLLAAVREAKDPSLPEILEALIACRDDREQVCSALGRVFDRKDVQDVIAVYLDEGDECTGYLIAGFIQNERSYAAVVSIWD